MSQAYLLYLAGLFDSYGHSDCSIIFCVEVGGPPAPKRPRTRRSTFQHQSDAGQLRVKELPAHLMVLCGGSKHFAALYKRLQSETPTVPSSGNPGPSPRARPELTFRLDSAEELPYAYAAVRFIYTGKLESRASTAELLQIRRQAARMQISECLEKIDEVIASRVTTTAGVKELYACRHLLPTADEAPSTASLMRICRKHITHNCGAYIATLQPAAALGELLAWLFPDAASVLSDPDTRLQVQALPATAMEALFRCDAFATDNEASVLLMLAYWLTANGGSTGSETRVRLCRLIRLSQLNTAYLHGLLPKITWFPLTREEHQFLCQYLAETDVTRRKSLAVAAQGRHDCTSLWYTAKPRPIARADVGKPYDWIVMQQDLAADLDLVSHKIPGGLTGAFVNGASRLVAHGFEWYPGGLWFNDDGVSEAVLSCAVPAPLAAFTSARDVVGVVSVAAQISVFRWRAGGRGDGATDATAASATPSVRREEAASKKYGNNDVVTVTSGVTGSGWRLLILGKSIRKEAGASTRLMPLLAPYLHDGKLSGSVTFWSQ
ncbi:hypothetical protein Vretimale_858 [Volvox reticuliferus]|uniref:Uncharacterized protein n=1 Tax=Volvox reticuliferus TaxID=1737510 RepID=A0A8J4G150_9CHLO|nr:hypothetical protein Vretifemale_2220 [Volvox reticuliferus]GIL94630.1 hypothetical protein Vretimale_858 [Volvox reticuliferus]